MKKLISTTLLLLSCNTMAADVGTVLFTAKDVSAENNGAKRALSRGAALQEGDTIVTAADASAKIKYTNGTLVSLGPSSNYKIVSYAPKQSDVTLTAQLNQGKLESQTSGTEKREALKTPVVALAINGTSYKVFVPPCKDSTSAKGKASCKKANIQLLQGEIVVGNQVLHPGESILATPTGIIQAPFPAAGNVPATVSITPSTTAGGTSSTVQTGGASASTGTNSSSGTIASTVNFVNTTNVVSTTVTTTTTVSTTPVVTGIATFSLGCIGG